MAVRIEIDIFSSRPNPVIELKGNEARQAIERLRANNRCPKEGHLVALVIWPTVDFHWYRKGRNGYWSHKPAARRSPTSITAA